MRAAFIRGLIKAAENNPRVMLITGDLGYRFLEPFAEKFPDRFLNIGVAESNLVSVAAGLSTTGFIPFIYSIATFMSMRAFEQIRTDIVMQRLNVKIVGIGGGLAYNKAGPTHHSMEDIALMRTLPGMIIVAPVDTFETEAATTTIALYDGPCYLRLERNPEKPFHHTLPVFRIGKGYQISGKAYDKQNLVMNRTGLKECEIALLVTGTKVILAEETAELLNKNGFKTSIYAFPTISPIDTDYIERIKNTHQVLVTIEEHRISGGFGSAVGEILLENDGKNIPQFVKMGLKDEFTPVSADYRVLMDYHGLNPKGLVRRIIKLIGSRCSL
jgi:transketolase